MTKLRRNAPSGMLAIGLIFLVIGFVQQEFTFNFKSGLFTMGLIFTLSGLVANQLKKKPKE